MLDKNENKHFERKNDSQHRYNETLFGDAAFNKYLGSIQVEIGGKALIALYQEVRIRVLTTQRRTRSARRPRSSWTRGDRTAQRPFPGRFHSLAHLGEPRSGPCHLPFSHQQGLCRGLGRHRYRCFQRSTQFQRRAIDSVTASEFTGMMYPTHGVPIPSLIRATVFSDEQMRHLTALDQNNDPCLDQAR